MGGLLEPGRAMTPHEHAGLKVSTSEVFALGELAEGGAMSQQDLADRLGLEKSTVSRLAAALEARGWIARERDPGNRRSYRLALTGPGLEATRRIGDELQVHHGQLLSRLTPDERRALSVGLGALVRAMSEEHGVHGPRHH
jgi:DNA-binding MarR family transcriptional regulator